MTYKEQYQKEWIKAGGLITKSTASKILGVHKSVLSKNKNIKIWKIEDDQFVSFQDIINRTDIKPRKKHSKKTLKF